MEATMAYQAGKPIVTDEEYDQLKRELRNKNSMVTQQVRILSLHAAVIVDYVSAKPAIASTICSAMPQVF